jgi:hypothetical protein
MLLKPALGILNGKDRILLLAPMRRPCCLELLFCHLVILSGEFRALSSGRAREKPVMAFFRKAEGRSHRSLGSFPSKKAAPNNRYTVHCIAKNALNTMKRPLDFLPSIPQDDRTAMRAAGWVLGLR